jgi:hypothetical protein
MVTRREIAQSERNMHAHIEVRLVAFAAVIGEEVAALDAKSRQSLRDELRPASRKMGYVTRDYNDADDTVIDLPPMATLRMIAGGNSA